MPYLRFNIGLLEGQPARKVMLVAALDAVWSCVVGCSLTEKAFLQAQGVFLLLDALETCPAELHNIILGLLVDLCETDAALQHALAWQGQSDLRLNVVHVLLRVWSQACKSLRCQGVCPSDGHLSLELDEHGRWLPLAGQEQRQLMEASGAASRPPVHSAAVQDVLGTVRAKVHALCGRIGFARCFDMAGAEGRLALVAVEQYMNLKATEVWQEILHELKVENVAVVEVSVGRGPAAGGADWVFPCFSWRFFFLSFLFSAWPTGACSMTPCACNKWPSPLKICASNWPRAALAVVMLRLVAISREMCWELLFTILQTVISNCFSSLFIAFHGLACS